MPLGFSGGSELIRLGERYGNDLAASIQQTGQKIEMGLQRVTTQRQLQGLGATLSNIDPKSPDYTQKLIALGSEYPFAMQDPRGQAMMAMGAKEHYQWQEQQQAQQRMQQTLSNQMTMQGVRQKDALALVNARKNSEPDVNLDGLLDGSVPLNSRQENAGFRMGAGMPSLSGAPITEGEGEDSAPLFGTNEQLSELKDRALRPLAEVKKITGAKITGPQVVSALASEKRAMASEKRQQMTFEQQAKMQAERERASDEALKERERATDERASGTEERMSKKMELTRLKTAFDTNEKDITAYRRTLNTFLSDMEEKKKNKEPITKEDERRSRDLHAQLEDAGKERVRLENEMKSLTAPQQSAPKGRFRWENGELVPIQ